MRAGGSRRWRRRAQSARGLGFAVQVPDLQRPEIAQAELQSGSAVIGGRTYRDIHLFLRSQRREISADVAIAGGQTLALSLRGRWTRERRAAVIESFSLASGGARWTQQGPLRLGYGAGRATVEGLDLRAGAQRIRADVDAREQKVSARVDVDRLDLAALPRPLLPASLPALEGLLDLHADLSGTRRRPELAARVELAHGRVGRYRGLALALDGRYDGDRARATIAASGLGASVKGKLDVPARWPVRDPGAPVVADLEMRGGRPGASADGRADHWRGDGRAEHSGRATGERAISGRAAAWRTIRSHAAYCGYGGRPHAGAARRDLRVARATAGDR